MEAKGKPVTFFKPLLRMEPDGDTTNMRNVRSKHRRDGWAPKPLHVPFNSFSELLSGVAGLDAFVSVTLHQQRPVKGSVL